MYLLVMISIKWSETRVGAQQKCTAQLEIIPIYRIPYQLWANRPNAFCLKERTQAVIFKSKIFASYLLKHDMLYTNGT